MGPTTVLLIESARKNGATFSDVLARKYNLRIAHSGKQGLALAQEDCPDVIVLDAASLRTSGDRIAARLRTHLGQTPIIHIKPEDGTRGQSAADLMLYLPFTGRKLSNRIDRFTSLPERSSLRKSGLFSLNLETQTLSTPWSEKKLTPKLMKLADLFLQYPGQVLERKDIMQKVWETDYVEDTRTLDVHIRWLRQVVEPNPRKPQYLVTVRGKGYRFEFPKDEAESGSQTASAHLLPQATPKVVKSADPQPKPTPKPQHNGSSAQKTDENATTKTAKTTPKKQSAQKQR